MTSLVAAEQSQNVCLKLVWVPGGGGGGGGGLP